MTTSGYVCLHLNTPTGLSEQAEAQGNILLPMSQRPKSPDVTTSPTEAYLVPSANPVWSWRLRGGLDALGAPTILGNLPYTHYR